MARPVIDPMTGKPLKKGRPVENAGPSKSDLPDPTGNMPSDRLAYHRNKKVPVFANTYENRMTGNAGRARDPEGGAEGFSSQAMRKGRPNSPSYSGSLPDRAGLAATAGNAALYQGIFGKKKKKGK